MEATHYVGKQVPVLC